MGNGYCMVVFSRAGFVCLLIEVLPTISIRPGRLEGLSLGVFV